MSKRIVIEMKDGTKHEWDAAAFTPGQAIELMHALDSAADLFVGAGGKTVLIHTDDVVDVYEEGTNDA